MTTAVTETPVVVETPVTTPVAESTTSLETSPTIPVVATPTSDAPVIAEAIKPAEVVDEGYDLELSADSPLTAEELNEIAETAGKFGLSKEDAEKLISDREKSYKAGSSKFESAYQEKIAASRKQIETDPDFQGDKRLETFASINRAVEKFGDAELVALLNTPEVGNNIVIARFLKRLGDTMNSDSLPGKGVVAPTVDKGNTALENLYPGFFKK
jgi:hypothetical protein